MNMNMNMNDTISNSINNFMKSNGMQSNGMQSNGMQSNGMQSNGMQSNGMQSNGMQSNQVSSGDLQQQELINKALISAGLPQNKLNDLIEQARDKLMCDPDCQKKRKGDAYKQKWELAKKNYKAAPEEVKLAEKNYYVFDKGYGAYKDMLYDRYSKTAVEFKTASNKKHADVDEELQLLLANYTDGTIYLKRMNELLQIKLAEKEELKHDIDAYIGFTETSGRKVIYEDRERDWLTTYRQIMLYMFFAIIIIYIIFGNFIPNKAYKQWKVWLILSLFIVFPYFLVDKLVKYIFTLYSYLTSWRLKKNVYRNL